MKKIFLTALLSIFLVSAYSQAISELNGGFEKLDNNFKPAGWILGGTEKQKMSYIIELDSIDKEDGKYAISITKVGDSADFRAIRCTIPSNFTGSTIELRGYIKTKGI